MFFVLAPSSLDSNFRHGQYPEGNTEYSILNTPYYFVHIPSRVVPHLSIHPANIPNMDSDPPIPPNETWLPPNHIDARKTLFGSTPSPLSTVVGTTEDSSTKKSSSTTWDEKTSEVLHYLPLPKDYFSPVWAHFHLLDPKYHPTNNPKDRQACCKNCRAILKISKGISPLWTHIRSHEKNAEFAKSFQETEREKKQKFAQSLKATSKKTPKERNQEILEATVCWVVEENLPFNMVEKKSFRQMCNSLLNGAPVITSSQVRSEIKSLGDVCRESVQKELHG